MAPKMKFGPMMVPSKNTVKLLLVGAPVLIRIRPMYPITSNASPVANAVEKMVLLYLIPIASVTGMRTAKRASRATFPPRERE